jgi:hypothetical protein
VKGLSEPFGTGRRMALATAAITFALLALLAIAARAQATETLYWDNYDGGSTEGVSFANIDGIGGGSLNVAAAEVNNAEGMAFDPANGRIYVANSGTEQIVWVAVDGSGSGVLDTGSAPLDEPEGITIDLKTQTVYWANDASPGSIGYASANGGGGGSLNTTGATVVDPYRPAIDTANNRIYWVNTNAETFASADLGGGGGSDLPLSGAPVVKGVHGINIDPAAGRLYWVDYEGEKIGWVNTSGVGGGEIVGGNMEEDPYGLAFDPTAGLFYWGNYDNGDVREEAIGLLSLAGSPGGITPATAPVAGPQDPLILKSPTGAGAPAITQQVAALSCSQGSWSQDYPGSFVYSAPVRYAYQWSLNGQAISGATGSSLTATTAGSYSCSVTGSNVTGSASQTSGSATVTPASLTATLQTEKPHAKAGKAAVVKLGIANSGDLASAPVTVCAELGKKAKKGLKAPKCASVVALGNGGSAVATLSVKTLKTAKGPYKFTALIKGATVKPVTVTVKVTAAQAKKKKHPKHPKTK